MDNLTKLFGTKTIGDWERIRQKIIDNPEVQENWIEATNLLEERLNTRYFQPIERILNIPNYESEWSFCGFIDNVLSEIGIKSSPDIEEKSVMALSGEGFAAMTLICSLIEFLQSCYEGKKYHRDNPDDDFEYGDNLGSSRKFKKFLECQYPFSSIFAQTFTNSAGTTNTFAEDFYTSVRCGLLHEAATNNNWIIREKHSNPDTFVDISNHAKKIIYRNNFFKAIKKYFGEYKQKIIDNGTGTINVRDRNDNTFPTKNIYLRHAFCRKIDFLCEMHEPVANRTGDWWNLNRIYF